MMAWLPQWPKHGEIAVESPFDKGAARKYGRRVNGSQ